MNNLLSNALKYTEQGFIHYGFHRGKKYLEIFVKDSGIGISKEEQKNIFDYFHKVDTSETKFYQGSGIGLTICKRLITMMGSSIYVDSESYKGSRFYFKLPWAKKEPDP
jgi:signal transduction histidine kinase